MDPDCQIFGGVVVFDGKVVIQLGRHGRKPLNIIAICESPLGDNLELDEFLDAFNEEQILIFGEVQLELNDFLEVFGVFL